MDLHELVTEREWRRCFPDWSSSVEERLEGFRYFCATYWFIQTPHGRQLFELFDEQLDAARAFLDSRYVIALKARQIGFSTLVAAFVFWCCYGYRDRRVFMLSKGEREAAELLAKASYGSKQLPEWMRLRGPIVNSNLTKMTFSHASEIESLPSGKNPARGMTAWLVVLDEMAFLEYPHQAWASVEPVVDVGGRAIILSTANGEGNIFHALWVGSQTKAGLGRNFKGIFYPWSARKDRDELWYESKREELPPWQLAQEYPDNPEEAFIRSGNPFFDIDSLREIETVAPDRGYLVNEGHGWQFKSDGGALRLWALPSERGVYCIGVDVAEGLEHGDYSSVHVIECREGDVVAHWHGRIDPDLLASEVLLPLYEWYLEPLVGIEVNNHGLTTVKAAQRVGIDNLYRQRRYQSRAENMTELVGWRTTSATKPLAADELAKALRDQTLYLPCEETIAELRTYVREGNGKLHGSPHDDRVMSLAIANQMRNHVWLPEYRRKRDFPVGSWGWFDKKFFPKGNGSKRVPIGANSFRSRVR